jgi:hypothetical protein
MTDENKRIKEEYIGDAVYVSFDGFALCLRTGDSNNQRIYVEPSVFSKLVDFAKSVDKHCGVNHFFKT